MAKRGRPRKIESTEQMYDMFKAYKVHRKTNPRIKYHLNQRGGEMVGEPLEVPLTMDGFEVFCWEKFDLTISRIQRFLYCLYTHTQGNT